MTMHMELTTQTVKLKTMILKTSLCDCSDAFRVVKGRIKIVGHSGDGAAGELVAGEVAATAGADSYNKPVMIHCLVIA